MKNLVIILLLPLCLITALSLVAQTSDKGMRIKEMQTEQRVALVIGNSDYKSRPLRNPANDAKAMAVALRQCGFQVIEKTDCNRSEILAAVREFGDKIKRGGVGLFYYSGHGLQVERENYLVPVDANVRAEDEVEDECVKTSSVLRKMKTAGNRVNIVILDACRDNPFARSFGVSTRGLTRIDAPKGTFIAYATSPDSAAADGTGKNGVYTSALLKYIRESGLTIENVFKQVRREVTEDTSDRQVPWESSSLIGDFYFVLPDENDLPDAPRFRPPRREAPTESPVSMPRTKIGRDGAEMMLIPAGEFQMGTDQSEVSQLIPWAKKWYSNAQSNVQSRWFENELPRHTVYVDAFYMDKYEVTNALYKKFMDTTGHKAPYDWNDSKYNAPNQPVVSVTWEDAVAYAQWAGKRLPTEAEWEKAARGGLVGKRFPWGDSDPDGSQCNFADKNASHSWSDKNVDDGYQYAAPVGSYAPNGYGLYDMAGNVYEWCADWHDRSYYANSPKSNPEGPGSGTLRVVRGGSWSLIPSILRAANRGGYGPASTYYTCGFRCVSQD